MNHRLTRLIFGLAFASLLVPQLLADPKGFRRISIADYRDKVYGAWLGQVTGAAYGFPFEGQAVNAIPLDHTLTRWDDAIVDDDYYYEMVALYGFERFGIDMTVAQLGEMWKEYRAGTWGSSEAARLALERGIAAPECGSPRYNPLFYTIGPQFSSDIYGMLTPGMVNLAGATARKYSHVNGYAEGSDGSVFVASCISEAFFETNGEKIVRQAAQLIDPRSNYRQAIDFVLDGYSRKKPWKQIANESESRWRPEYPMFNNAVANGALVAIGILFGEGDYVKSINVATQTGDNTDADCNAANVSSVIGAMHGVKGLPVSMTEQFHDRIHGDHMGPLKFGRMIDEKISGLADRIAATGEKILLANGARRDGDSLLIPRQKVMTQPWEHFDINDYASLWNPDWKLAGAGRGVSGASYLRDDALVTYPRDTRPCRLEREVALLAGKPKLTLDLGADAGRPWRLQVFVNDEKITEKTIGTGEISQEKEGEPRWTHVEADLSRFAGRTVILRLYQWTANIPATAYWRNAVIE